MTFEFKSNIRTTLAVLHDAVAAALSWSFAYLLRFNFELPDSFASELQRTLNYPRQSRGLIG